MLSLSWPRMVRDRVPAMDSTAWKSGPRRIWLVTIFSTSDLLSPLPLEVNDPAMPHIVPSPFAIWSPYNYSALSQKTQNLRRLGKAS